MPASRCTACGLDWPAHVMYNRCPQCDEGTKYDAGQSSMGNSEATERVQRLNAERSAAKAIEDERRKRHEDFEGWYADREVERFREEMDTYLSAKLGKLPTK